jgi:hypothetical protein
LEQFQRLKQSLNINEINQKNSVINYGNQMIIYPVFSSLKLAAFNTEHIIRITPQDLQPIMMKHLAAKAIQQFSISDNKHELLMVHYPIETLIDPNFSLQIFYGKILHFNVSVDKIVLLLDLNFLDLAQDLQPIYNNISNLRKSGVRFVCSNVNIHNIDFVIKIKPYFIFYHDMEQTTANIRQHARLMKQLLTKAKVNIMLIK